MSALERLVLVEESLRLLQAEIQQIKRDTQVLDEENQSLRRQLCHIDDNDCQQVIDNGEAIQRTALANLEKLYVEGFHVCHLFFGRERNGECLFCQGFFRE